MSLDKAVNQVVASVPECLAGGYVDLTSGMLLGIKTVDSHPQEIIDLLAAATADLFQGQNVSMIETMFKRARGLKEDNHHYFQEVIVNSDNLIHVFMRGKLYPDNVLVLVCRKSVNLGMVLTKARMTLPMVEAEV
ncbi:MAG: hypothetical protein LBE24_08050 [Methylobacillus sp.]|jgi:hypothetical protein|nr:hypothetical protein [Methylobacillus sp.]